MKRTPLRRKTPLKPMSDKKRASMPGYAKTRKRVLERDKGHCIICHTAATDTHHILYRSQGGTDSDWNLASLCRACHYRVHTEGPTMWRPALLAEVERRQNLMLKAKYGQ